MAHRQSGIFFAENRYGILNVHCDRWVLTEEARLEIVF